MAWRPEPRCAVEQRLIYRRLEYARGFHRGHILLSGTLADILPDAPVLAGLDMLTLPAAKYEQLRERAQARNRPNHSQDCSAPRA
jgi:hypothetical protein